MYTWEKHPWDLVNGSFCFLNPAQFDPKNVLEGLYSVGGAFTENKTYELHNSGIIK